MEADEPRALTDVEMRERVFRHVAGIADYWAKVEHKTAPPGCPQPEPMSVQYRLNGLVHSIFAMIEGRSLGIPSLDLIPAPHETDKDYMIDHGENWWEPIDLNDGGSLCSQWSKFQPPE